MGIHEFPFSTVIPKDCPPTFKGSNGENKYEVEVLTDVPWRFTSKARMEFTVNKKLVLPEKYWTDEVTKIRNIKSGYIFNEGPISVKMTLPKVVFQIGDSLRLRLDINNTSSSEISRFSIHFFRLTHYHSRHLSVPCKSPMNCPMCPSSRKETRQRFGKISDFDFHVASHSEGSKVIDLGIPMEATTPSFESGLMTMRYYICSYVWVKNGLPIWCGTNKIYIGEKKEKIKKPSKGDAPPDYTP
uniref:Arrestin_C domain-containing protein n=1 Tax=Caenorhabditis tropicalis TaxID=1561998 RepID=A0A1I7TA04_9PELO